MIKEACGYEDDQGKIHRTEKEAHESNLRFKLNELREKYGNQIDYCIRKYARKSGVRDIQTHSSFYCHTPIKLSEWPSRDERRFSWGDVLYGLLSHKDAFNDLRLLAYYDKQNLGSAMRLDEEPYKFKNDEEE